MNATPKHGHAPIKMRRCPDALFQAAGDFKWLIAENDTRTLALAIPCSGEKGWCYSRWTIDHKNTAGAQWSWNGNEDAPTLSPSLHAVEIWHGWVKAGELIEA